MGRVGRGFWGREGGREGGSDLTLGKGMGTRGMCVGGCALGAVRWGLPVRLASSRRIVIVKVWGSFLSLAVLWPGRLPFDPSLTTTGGLARGLLSLD